MYDRSVGEKDQSSFQTYLYASDKERLRALVDEMSKNAAASIEKSVLALKERDRELAKKVIDEDDMIDEKEEQIDQECLYSIAMRQPVREDLRFVYSVMKIVVDLERIGDQAVNIAMNVLDVPEGTRFPKDASESIESMAAENIKMLSEVMEAFAGEDETVICSARERRRTVKKMRNDAVLSLNILLDSEKTCERDKLKLFSIVLLTLRHLSRISDHVLNLAERVSFIATGISPLTLKRAQEENGKKKANL